MNETDLDWKTAKQHFDEVRRRYQDLEGMPGVNTSLALRFTFDPLSVRFNKGERSEELFNEMSSVE
jgi:predicted Ser/Thr protein kinase